MQKTYKIVQCRNSGDYYGNCERCGKPANPHYKQVWQKSNSINIGWVSCGYGHIDCLRNGNWAGAPVTGVS